VERASVVLRDAVTVRRTPRGGTEPVV